jgi:uncharacterized membrane protein
MPAALLVVLLLTLLRYFKRAFAGKKILIKGFWVYLYVVGMFIILSEFDHLSIITGALNGAGIEETIMKTARIPYSMLLLLSSMIVLVIGFVLKSRFLRLFSLFILAGVGIKILVYDMFSLEPLAKMILFLIMGIVLLGISLFYPRIRQSFFQKDSSDSS